MAKRCRDHFVQQLLVRQFLNEEGKVFCFDKKHSRIPDEVHGNRPRDILFERGYYSDQLGSLDRDLYKPIEEAFAPFLLQMVRDIDTAVHLPSALRSLQDWVAAQLTRTQQIESLVKAYVKKFGRDDLQRSLDTRDGYLNSVRLHFFHKEREQMAGLVWRAYRADENEPRRFVLADEPVIKTPPTWATGTMYIVPLSPTLLIAAGTPSGHQALKDPNRNILPMGVNGLAMSYANRFVYSSRLIELKSLERMCDFTGDAEHGAWMRQAREPNFALENIIMAMTDEDVAALAQDDRKGDGTTDG